MPHAVNLVAGSFNISTMVSNSRSYQADVIVLLWDIIIIVIIAIIIYYYYYYYYYYFVIEMWLKRSKLYDIKAFIAGGTQ